MRRQEQWWMAAAVVVVLALGNVLWAANPAPTTITIPDMHCGGCGKKVAAKLYELPGVAKVEPNVQAKIVRVLPKPQTVLSPRFLWEAVEKAGKKPTKLEGPSGTFTSKPRS